MGLFATKNDLPTRRMPERDWSETGEFVVSRMTPFSGRMVVERLDCVSSNESEGQSGETVEEYVRVLVSDAVQSLGFCRSSDQFKGRSDKLGLCSLKDFVESQAYARSGGDGDWERCFEMEES